MHNNNSRKNSAKNQPPALLLHSFTRDDLSQTSNVLSYDEGFFGDQPLTGITTSRTKAYNFRRDAISTLIFFGGLATATISKQHGYSVISASVVATLAGGLFGHTCGCFVALFFPDLCYYYYRIRSVNI